MASDLLMRCDNYDLFLVEAEIKSPELVNRDPETNELTKAYDSTPTVSNDAGETMWLVRPSLVDMVLFEKLDTVTIMGSYDEVFADAAKLEDYKRIYPYDVPVDYIDEQGNPQQYYRPERFCEIA